MPVGTSRAPLAATAQPLKFVLVGAAGYLANLGLFATLHAAGVPYGLNAVVSYFVANAFMYLGNRYFTFRLGHEGFWGAYLRYMVVGALVGSPQRRDPCCARRRDRSRFADRAGDLACF